MVPYVATIPGTDVQFEMIPVPRRNLQAGERRIGGGQGRRRGPQVEITLQPYWVGKTEVTWAEYKRFMGMYKIFKNLQSQRIRRVDASNRADAITVPTPLYEPSHTFEYGEDPQQPAVTMTQYAAKQYSKWVSGLTGNSIDFRRKQNGNTPLRLEMVAPTVSVMILLLLPSTPVSPTPTRQALPSWLQEAQRIWTA